MKGQNPFYHLNQKTSPTQAPALLPPPTTNPATEAVYIPMYSDINVYSGTLR